MYPPGMECSALINSESVWGLEVETWFSWQTGSCSLGGGKAGREGALGVGTSQPSPPRGDCSGQVRITCGQWLVSVGQPKVSEEPPQLVCLGERKIDQFP